MTWLPALLGRLASAFAKLGPLIAAYLAGAQRERLKSTEAAIDAAKTRITVEDEVRRLGDGTASAELRDQWKR